MPKLDAGAGVLRARAAAFIESAPAAALFDGAILVNTVTEIWRIAVEVEGAPTATTRALVNVQRATLGVFALEFSVKLCVWGVSGYIRGGAGTTFDLLMISTSIVAAAIEVLTGALDQNVAFFVTFMRSVRLSRYFSKARVKLANRGGVVLLPSFDAAFAAAAATAAPLARHAALAVAVGFAFALLGCEFFAGRLSLANASVAASSYGRSAFRALNFDSMNRAALATFTVATRSNWPVLCEGAVAGTQSLWARAWFVLFLVCEVVVVASSAAAFAFTRFAAERAAGAGAAAAGAPPPPPPLDAFALAKSSGADFSGYILARERAAAEDAAHAAAVRAAFPTECAAAPQGIC